MALFEAYTKPGVYVRESIEDAGIPLFGTARVPVLIGEGEEFRSRRGVGLHRGSSTYADEQVVRENLTDQVDGQTRKFKLPYTPVVLGDGKGTITNAPQDIKVYANDLPILVSSLNGKTGEFTTQNLLMKGTDLRVDYFFKRSDTEVLREDLSNQVPYTAHAVLGAENAISTSVTTPGALGNLVSITLVPAQHKGEYKPGVALEATVSQAAGKEQARRVVVDFIKATKTTPQFTFTDTLLTVILTGQTWGDIHGTFETVSDPVNKATITITVAATEHMKDLVVGTNFQLDLQTVQDIQAIHGIGTDSITVALADDKGNIRNNGKIAALLSSGVFTLSAGTLLASTTKPTAIPSVFKPAITNLVGGSGPSTNKTFTVKNYPIVDGSNGGVVTTSPSDIKVLVNGVDAKVASVVGEFGQFTLVNAVPEGSDLRVSYFYNTFRDTFDVLPGDNIVELTAVGFGEGRSDFIEGVDYVLEKTDKGGALIQWGASTSVKEGVTAEGTTPFTMPLTPTIRDERVYLRPVIGVTNGINTKFQLEDAPVYTDYKVTDGTQRSKVTDDPAKIKIFCGSSPFDAASRPPLRVVSLNGPDRTFVLYNPPAPGSFLYATYDRSVLNDHSFTLEVLTPGVTGQGTYKITNENGKVAPWVKEGEHKVPSGAFANSGILWPFAFSDLRTQVGATAEKETITLTFEDHGQYLPGQGLPTQAGDVTVVPGLKFYASKPGPGGNATKIVLKATKSTPDAQAVAVDGETITVQILKGSGQTRTIGDVLNLFNNPANVADITTPSAGRVCCKLASSDVVTTTAVAEKQASFIGGASGDPEAKDTPISYKFRVTSNRTPEDMKKDGFGITEGIGYLGQTFVSQTSGVQFTIVDPQIKPSEHPEYGVEAASPAYFFKPGDVLTFDVDILPRQTSAVPTLDVPGVRLKVTSTYGMATGNTATLNLYNKSGNEPATGDFYYVDYKVAKTAKDFGLKLFTNITDVYAEYGKPTATNKLSLAARLFNQNGGGLLGCIQVPKQIGMETASDQSFIAAIESLARPLPGSESKASVIVPLTTSPTVLQVLNRHLITQSSQRMGGEAIAYVGFGINDTPNDARKITRSLKTDRMIALYPGGAILTIDINGRAVEFAVGGEFIAAAACGMDMNPAFDLATSFTRKALVGFDRLVERYDDAIMDLAAADGVCWLVERSGSLQFRHYITTDPSNPIKREPTNRKVADAARTRLRRNLDQFIARKVLSSLTSDISIVVHQTFKSMMAEELVAAYSDVVVQPDPADDTVIHVSVKFKPISSLMWLDVNLTVTQKM